MKLKNPLTIKRINRTNRTFTTKLYPLQYDYCIEMGLLSNKGIGRNQYRTEIKKKIHRSVFPFFRVSSKSKLNKKKEEETKE
jgi:hypothetical protein